MTPHTHVMCLPCCRAVVQIASRAFGRYATKMAIVARILRERGDITVFDFLSECGQIGQAKYRAAAAAGDFDVTYLRYIKGSTRAVRPPPARLVRLYIYRK